jgi:polyribonucleotide nucleotidyltransferase
MTSRRETGHGNLAERSLVPVIPADYPYSIRVVSEIMESNGSSSMASVCAGTLALMDAGVPITKPVAGISVGLFSDQGKSELVLDILGAEDHCGDMDFKVTGTRQGITGFQVDLKTRGLAWDLVEKAFSMANKGRHTILDYMQTVISESRSDLSAHAPRIQVLKINPEKIGALIGPGGKNIRRITDISGAKIDINDDGTVQVFASEKQSMDIAVREISALTAEPEVGKVYQGIVTGTKEFGAFVEFMPGKEGLVHISELADYRVKAVEDICKIGDQMWVKCLAVDEMSGKVRLSRKAALAEMDVPQG